MGFAETLICVTCIGILITYFIYVEKLRTR